MKIYLHSDNAERHAAYSVHVCPAGDTDWHSDADRASFPSSWLTHAGDPKQIEIVFVFGAATVSDELGRYMVARGIAHKHRMLRKIRMFFDKLGKPIEELFDENGARVFYDEPKAA